MDCLERSGDKDNFLTIIHNKKVFVAKKRTGNNEQKQIYKVIKE